MKGKYDLVCIGDVVMDAFITLKDDEARILWDKKHEHEEIEMPFATKIPYESLTVATAVGNSSNVVVGAARLGLKTGIITAIGGDEYGRQILDWYKKERVNPEFVRVNRALPTNYHFVLTYEAERTILIKHQDYQYYDPRKLDARTDWLYFSSIGEHALFIHDQVAEYLRKHPNVRMGFNPGTFQLKFGVKRLREIYKYTHVLFLNREEAELVAGKREGTPLPELMDALHALGPKIVVVTDGPNGAYASDRTASARGEVKTSGGMSGGKWFMPPYPDPRPPISRTGAGDAFSTGFMAALIYGLPVHEALRWAPIESMHVVQFLGAQAGLLSKPKLLQILKDTEKICGEGDMKTRTMKSLREILTDAASRHVAVGHFNISELGTLKGIFAAALALANTRGGGVADKLPILIGVSEGEREFIGVRQAVALIRSLREQYEYPIFLNADHTHSLEKVREAAEAGFDEILFDGSHLPFEENLQQTQQAIKIIRNINPDIIIEGEIGYIGSNSEIVAERPAESLQLSTPEEAIRFANETGIDVLAPAVGNMHGLLEAMAAGTEYKRLNIARIGEISAALGAATAAGTSQCKFMTLHGGSGTDDGDFAQAIAKGMTIIHVSSELRLAWRRGIESALVANANEIAPYKLMALSVDSIGKIVLERLKLFNNLDEIQIKT